MRKGGSFEAPLTQVRTELVVDRPANHLGKFFSHGLKDRCLALERRGIFSAPPMKVIAACAPMLPIPLSDRRRDVA